MGSASRQPRRRFIGRLLISGASLAAGLGGGIRAWGDPRRDRVAVLRPPGALPESQFVGVCIRCGRCGDACPNRSIVPFTETSGRDLGLRPGRGQFGTPVIFPRRQSCMLCTGIPGDHLLCTAACPVGALQLVRKTPEAILDGVRMGVARIDRNLCYSYNGSSCGVCVRACPLEGVAIRAGMWERPIVDAERCVGCGCCERSCVRYPQAIRVVPREERV